MTTNYKTRAGIREWLQKPKEDRRREWFETMASKNAHKPQIQEHMTKSYYKDQDLMQTEYLSTWYPNQPQDWKQQEDEDDYWG